MRRLRSAAWRARRRAWRAARRVRLRHPGTRIQVGLVGYFGWGNYGDELFCRVFEEHLAPHVDLRILYDRLDEPRYTRAVRTAAEDVDAILIGGGDLVRPWSASAAYWHRAYLRRPVCVVGVGVPTNVVERPRAHAVHVLHEFFSHPSVRYVSARDEASAAWIEAELRPRVPVRRTSDLVCALTLPAATPASPPTLGIVTRQRRDHVDDYGQVAALARAAQQRGMAVRHIVLGTGRVGARDLADAQRLDVPGKELVCSEDLDTLSRAIGECRLLASMKFHGSVVATMYGVPSIVLMPTAKNRRFYDRIGRPELVRSFTDENLADLLDPLPDRIDPAVVDALRADAMGGLGELRAAIETAARRPRRC